MDVMVSKWMKVGWLVGEIDLCRVVAGSGGLLVARMVDWLT